MPLSPKSTGERLGRNGTQLRWDLVQTRWGGIHARRHTHTHTHARNPSFVVYSLDTVVREREVGTVPADAISSRPWPSAVVTEHSTGGRPGGERAISCELDTVRSEYHSTVLPQGSMRYTYCDLDGVQMTVCQKCSKGDHDSFLDGSVMARSHTHTHTHTLSPPSLRLVPSPQRSMGSPYLGLFG